MRAADQEAERQRQAGDDQERVARRLRLHVEAEDVLEVGQAVIAAEAEIVAEEAEQQRIGHRLGDDREIDAGDAAAEGEPAEHEGEQARHQQDHQRGIGEMLEAVPVDRQLLPVQEHHEVGQDRIGIDAAGADLPHQIHAHGVAAEREEGAMAERQDAGIAPDQVDRERQQRVAEVFAEQRDQIGRDVQRRARPAPADSAPEWRWRKRRAAPGRRRRRDRECG